MNAQVTPARLTGARIRRTRFRRVRWSGVDDRSVQEFLGRVAAELEALTQELAVARDENARLKAALRDWHTAVGVAPVRRVGHHHRGPAR